MKTRFGNHLPLFFSLALVLAACSNDETPQMTMADAPAAEQEVANDRGAPESDDAKPAPGVAPKERMVIKTASMTLQSDGPEETAAEARSMVESAGGFIVRSDTKAYARSANQVSLVMRVPAEKFDATLRKLRELGDPVAESIRGQDVTEEYVDVQAQLRNQKQLESRFLSLLENAATVAETLEIEREIARVRTEIDRLEGRSKFLRDQVAMSTIDLTVTPKPELFGDGGPKLGEEVVEAFDDARRLFVGVVGGLIRAAGALLPLGLLLLVFGGVARFLYRRYRDRR